MANITSYLRGSRLVSQRISKDRYTLRNAPQWLGPQLADFVSCASANYNWAPLNGSNPLIDVDGGRIHHGANFQVVVLKSVMEKTILTLPTLGFLLLPQCTELISGRFNNGLPLNLCTDIHKSPTISDPVQQASTRTLVITSKSHCVVDFLNQLYSK